MFHDPTSRRLIAEARLAELRHSARRPELPARQPGWLRRLRGR